MILFWAQDVGPTKYLMSIEKMFENAEWYKNEITKNLLSNKKIVDSINPNVHKLIITGTSLGPSIDKKLIHNAKASLPLLIMWKVTFHDF